MPNVTIRNVPDPIHAALVARAEDAGQSLQAYLQGLLASAAVRPPVRQFAAELVELAWQRERTGGGIGSDVDTVALIRQGRDQAARR
jgi:plasmid stability protein